MASQSSSQVAGKSDVASAGASETIPRLPSEIIEKIAIFLPLPDVCNCMLVCMDWKEYLSSELFCKTFLFKHYDFGLEEQPTGHLKNWTTSDEWFCYWTDQLQEDANAWVFSSHPKRWKCGIVHLADYSLESHKELKYKDFLRAVYTLRRIQNAADEFDLDCEAWGNEGAGVVEVCLFPWTKDTLPTAEDILTLFHFHPEMHDEPMTNNEVKEMEIEENNRKKKNGSKKGVKDVKRGHVLWNTLSTSYEVEIEKAISFFKWMKIIFLPFIRIGIGCEKMNPVPCFMLAQIAPGWVGGILTSLACT